MEPMPGTTPIIDSAIEEGAQTLFSAADVPLASTDQLLALIQGPAMRAVIEARIEQVVKHGHTPEGDADRPLRLLPNNARQMILDTLDLLDPGGRQNLVVGRRRLARAAALLLAAIDRVDVAIAANRDLGGDA